MPAGIYIRTEKSRYNNKGKHWKLSDASKDNISKGMLGIKKSLTHKENIRKAKLGSKNPAFGKPAHNKGKKGLSNEQHWNWKGGVSKHPSYTNTMKRKARLNTIGFHTGGEWELLKKQYGNTCPCCKQIEPEIKLTEDHIIPITKGGSDFIENIQPLCGLCNSRKFTKTIKYEISNSVV